MLSEGEGKDRAIKTIATYQYRETGMEKKVKDYTKEMLPDEMKKLSGLAVIGYTMVVNKRLELKWTF